MATQEEGKTLSKQWQRIVDHWKTTEQSQTVYCQAHGISYHQFGYWCRKFRSEERSDSSASPGGFIPVRLQKETSADGLSVILPSGSRIAGIRADNLSIVYQLLKHLS